MGVLRSEHGPPGVGFTCGVISSLLRQGRHRGTPCREAAYTLWRQLVEGREKSQKLDAVAYRIGGWVHSGGCRVVRKVVPGVRCGRGGLHGRRVERKGRNEPRTRWRAAEVGKLCHAGTMCCFWGVRELRPYLLGVGGLRLLLQGVAVYVGAWGREGRTGREGAGPLM